MNKLLDQKEYGDEARKLISTVGIPSQPRIITEVNTEIKKPEANIMTVSEIISKDVAMSAKLLKVINSAFFGLREKVDSIDRALSLMGLKNFNSIILSSAFRDSLGNQGPSAEKFWNHSMTAASAASYIAKKVGYPDEDQAYTAGLFHDCGVSLLEKKFPDYIEVSEHALSIVNSESLQGVNKSIIGVEDERFATHHCAIGYLVAKSWKLSTAVIEAIWYHHYINVDIHKDPIAKRLSSILILADYISSHILYLTGGECSVDSEAEWAKMHTKVITELDLNAQNIKDIKDDLTDKLYG